MDLDHNADGQSAGEKSRKSSPENIEELDFQES